jgi:hypothetical protein
MITYFSLYNCALAGAAAGMSSQKQALFENSGSLVAPTDSNEVLTTSAAYAAEVDALLVAATASLPTNVSAMVNDGATVVPTTPALASASAYLPVVMALMSKSTFDGRTIPKDSSGAAFSQAEWAASGIPNGVVAYFLAFSENTFVDGAGGRVEFIPLANVAMGAAMAGMISGRQDLYAPNGEPLTSANFAVHVGTAQAFAAEVDAQLQLQQAALGGSFPANITNLVNGGPDYATATPSSALLTNALYSLVPAMGTICKAIFDNRGIPKDNAGAAFVTADYADIANAVVAQFIEYAGSVETT